MPEPIFALGVIAFVFTAGSNVVREIRGRRDSKASGR